MDTSAILQATAHRFLPLPRGPWVMTQIWHQLLFSHWPVSPDLLRPLVPPQLPLDAYDGEAWVGIVPFRMTDVRPRGVPPVPPFSQFPELNVRTYVTVKGVPGVYFFSLDAGNWLAVQVVRTFFHLPYFSAAMSCRCEGETVHYRSRRVHRGAPSAYYEARYRPIAPVALAQLGSLEHWFTERYALFTTFHNHIYRADIHHRQWPLQPAEQEISLDTMARSHGIHLPKIRPLLHYADRQEVLVWPLHRV